VSSLKSQWAEILVAPRVEEVEGEPLVLEAHHRRGDRDAALALDRHPIRAHPPPLAARLDLARQLDRPAEQRQFLGQGGLAGVRMRNERKSAPAQNLVGQGTHKFMSAVAGTRAVAGIQAAPSGADDGYDAYAAFYHRRRHTTASSA
jgi:hypothetical protein